MRKIQTYLIAAVGCAVMAMAGLSVTAEVAQAAYCIRRPIPEGCLYKPIGRCLGVNCGEKMILDYQFPGSNCPLTYCETLDF
jgi:hypothetical protein